MANRRPQQGGNGGRRMDFNRNDGRKNFGRTGVSPWQGGGPGAGLPNLLPLAGGSTEATLALASNIINLLQPRQNPVPSLLDMPIRRDFGPQIGRFDRGFMPNRMGNQGNFRRTGNYNRAGERIGMNRSKQFKPNDGPKQPPKSSPKKEADSKAKPVKESENQEENKDDSTAIVEVKEEDSKKDSPKTRYDEINPQLLKCHICNKSMWDGRSFENHLSGRAHAIMMQKTAQSYALTADTMRQEFKIGTGYRRFHPHTASWTLPLTPGFGPMPPPHPYTSPWAWRPGVPGGPRDIREMKRNRRSGQQPPRDFYCAMCDMYAADGAVHRTAVGHRKLKKYLHPTCTSCHKEMPTRIELDEHRLTHEHLRNMQDKQEVVTKPKPEVMVISTLSMEQSYLRDDRQRRRRYDTQDDKQDGRDGDVAKEGEDNQDVAIKAEPGSEEDKNKSTDKNDVPDNEDTVLDYKEGDDLSHVTTEMLPAYSTKRGVGASFLGEFRCLQCRLCHKLLDTEETAEVHLRTWKHHQLFIKSLMPQNPDAGTNVKRPLNTDDDEGNWKRRKTNPGATNDDDALENGDVSMKAEPQGTDAGVDTLPDSDTLEDWSQTIDDILEDDVQNDEQEPARQAEPEPEPEPVKEIEPQPVKSQPVVQAPPRTTANQARESLRGRGRGRARGRGRY